MTGAPAPFASAFRFAALLIFKFTTVGGSGTTAGGAGGALPQACNNTKLKTGTKRDRFIYSFPIFTAYIRERWRHSQGNPTFLKDQLIITMPPFMVSMPS